MPQPTSERQRLLSLIADYCLTHSVAGLTLRRVGQSIGSNNRMLLYYFESREKMIGAALGEAAGRFPELRQAFDALDDRSRPLDERLDHAWHGIAAEANMPFTRLFFEVFGLAAHQPGRFDRYLTIVGQDWVNDVAAVLQDEGATAAEARLLARELVALWRGLQFDLLSGVDRRSVDEVHAASVRRLVRHVGRSNP